MRETEKPRPLEIELAACRDSLGALSGIRDRPDREWKGEGIRREKMVNG